MRRREFAGLLSVLAACHPVTALAQSKAKAKIAVIGSLDQGAIDAFKNSLREFGLVDGETITIIGKPASAASPKAVSKTISNLISQNIDLIFASRAVAGALRPSVQPNFCSPCISAVTRA